MPRRPRMLDGSNRDGKMFQQKWIQTMLKTGLGLGQRKPYMGIPYTRRKK